jgi:hypothetical protein
MIFSKEKRKQRDSLGKEVKRVSERFDIFFVLFLSLYLRKKGESERDEVKEKLRRRERS